MFVGFVRFRFRSIRLILGKEVVLGVLVIRVRGKNQLLSTDFVAQFSIDFGLLSFSLLFLVGALQLIQWNRFGPILFHGGYVRGIWPLVELCVTRWFLVGSSLFFLQLVDASLILFFSKDVLLFFSQDVLVLKQLC